MDYLQQILGLNNEEKNEYLEAMEAGNLLK